MSSMIDAVTDLPRAPWPITEDEIDYDACLDILLQAQAALTAVA